MKKLNQIDYKLGLKKIKNPKSPLEDIINEKLGEKAIRRMKFYSKLFDAFHLKNTVTGDVHGRLIILNGKKVLNFSSANYLGLEQHPQVIKAGILGIKKWGNHSGCSRFFSSHENILKLEQELSRLVGAEKTLICANVSQTHQGAIPALFSGYNSEIFIDKYAHTSMFQAALIAKAQDATITRVDIQDLQELNLLLKSSKKPTRVLLIDGVYSMQGNIPQLSEIQNICNQNNTILYIDDAHGMGVYGENGGGVAKEFNLSFENMILVGGLQKGFGAYGGFVSGNSSLIDLLRVSSKSYIFSGTLQPQAVEGSLAALKIIQSIEGKQLRKKLFLKSKALRISLQGLGFNVPDGSSPIIPVYIGKEIKTLMAGRKLYDLGFFVNSVLYPAVPKNEGLLRISMSAIHSESDINQLVLAFADLKSYLKAHQNSLLENSHTTYQVGKSLILGDNYRGL